MVTSNVMETRRRFQAVYGQENEEKDYGSMQNLADAHREYLRNIKSRTRSRQPQPPPPREQPSHVMIFTRLITGIMARGNITPRNHGLHQHQHFQPIPMAPQSDAVQFEAASFLRRLLAEFIDFMFFLSFKLFVVGILVELDVIDLKQFGQALEDDQDMMQFINLAQELLPVEVVCKIFCCFLEGVILATQIGPIGPGQTPGKWFVGIRVISCRDVLPGETPEHVIVDGPNLVTLNQSLKRSFMKNVVVNSLFPLSTAAFQVNNGRVFYDLIVKTVVVMELH